MWEFRITLLLERIPETIMLTVLFYLEKGFRSNMFDMLILLALFI